MVSLFIQLNYTDDPFLYSVPVIDLQITLRSAVFEICCLPGFGKRQNSIEFCMAVIKFKPMFTKSSVNN